jgi:hypothetical protein
LNGYPALSLLERRVFGVLSGLLFFEIVEDEVAGLVVVADQVAVFQEASRSIGQASSLVLKLFEASDDVEQ